MLDTDKSPELASVLENAGPPAGQVGTLVSSLIDAGGPLNNFSDADGDLPGIAITGVDLQGGALWYSVDAGTTWANVGTVSEANPRLLAAVADSRLYYQPATNFSGTISDFLSFKAWDGSSFWQQLGLDIDGDEARDYSGSSVSLSGDGQTVAIHGEGTREGINSAGYVRIYRWTGSVWSKLGTDFNGEEAYGRLGSGLALSSDGQTLAIGGAYIDGNGVDSGQTRIYRWSGTAWNQLGGDLNGEAAEDYAGERGLSLSADGQTVAIGATGNDGNGTDAGHVRIYRWTGTAWSQLGQDIDGERTLDASGNSVSLSSDGRTVAIGAMKNDGNGFDSGHVRVYRWTGSVWSKLGADINGEEARDGSGVSVSLSSDGQTVAVGANANGGNGNYAGHTRVYHWSGTAWLQRGNDIDGEVAYDGSGISVSLSSDGRIVAIGASANDGNGASSGHTRLYEWTGTTWVQLGGDIDGEAAEDQSGRRVSLSADGESVAIGAHGNDGSGTDSGHVRVFRLAPSVSISVDTISVTITESNKTPTEVAISSVTTPENTPIGTVIGTLSTTDPNLGDTFTYSLVAGAGDTDNASFEIVGDELRTREAFDYETKDAYTIRVRSTDAGGLFIEKEFAITIADVNEPPQNLSLRRVAFFENSPAGTAVAYLSAMDADTGDALEFSLVQGDGSDDNGLFVVAGDLLRTAQVMNYEDQQQFSIRLRATDNDGLHTELVASLTVEDENESPNDIVLSSSSISENQPAGTLVGELSSIDPDLANGHLGWIRMVGSDSLLRLEGFQSADAAAGWQVTDGVVERVSHTGHLASTEQYQHFEAQIDYRVGLRGNSGLFFHVQPDAESPVFSGPEVQIFDNGSLPLAQDAGWLYDLYQAQPGIDATNPTGEWNTIYLKVSSIGSTVSMNGVHYYSFTIGDDDWNSRVAASKYADSPGFASAGTGHLLIQDHNGDFAFRSFMVRPLTEHGTLVEQYQTNFELAPGPGDTDNNLFEIVDGQLFTKASFNHEVRESYSIRVVAVDEAGNSFSKQLSILIENEQESPSIDSIASITIDEDASVQSVLLSGITAGGGESQPLRVSATSSDTDLIPNPSVTYTSPNGTGSLAFTPAADQHGTATISVTVEDGGLDGDLATTGDNATFSRTFNVVVTPVNDEPTVDSLTSVTILEDATEQVLSLSGISAGGGESQPLRVTATSSNPGLIPDPSVTYASPDSTGSLAFTPVANQHGTATITVTIEDGGLDGDLATAEDNATFRRTFEVTVRPTNDAPLLDATKPLSLDQVTSSAGPPQGAVGTLVANLIDTGGALDNFLDLDGDSPGIAITATNLQGGKLWFTTDNGVNWETVNRVSETSALVLLADSMSRVYFQPEASFTGLNTDAFSFKAWGFDGHLVPGTYTGNTLFRSDDLSILSADRVRDFSVSRSGKFVTLLTYDDSLAVIDISQPARPILLNEYQLGLIQTRVAVSAEAEWIITADEFGSAALLTSPFSADASAPIAVDLSPSALGVNGEICFHPQAPILYTLSESTLTTHEIDAASGLSSAISSLALPPSGFVFEESRIIRMSFSHDGEQASITTTGLDGSPVVHLISLENPLEPVLAATVEMPASLGSEVYTSFSESGGNFYAGGDDAIASWDISAPTVPVFLGLNYHPSSAERTSFTANEPFIFLNRTGWSTSDPANPRKLYSIPWSAVSKTAQVGNSGLIIGSTSFGARVFDATASATPIVVAQTTVSQMWAEDLAVSHDGEFAYVVTDGGSGGGLSVVEITGANTLNIVGSVNLGRANQQVTYHDATRIAVVSSAHDGYHIVDVSNPTAPNLLSTIPLSYAKEAEISRDGSTLFLKTDMIQERFYAFDITDPRNPSQLSYIETSGWSFALADDRGIAFVGQSVVDVSDPTNMQLLESYPDQWIGSVREIFHDGRPILSGDRNSGVLGLADWPTTGPDSVTTATLATYHHGKFGLHGDYILVPDSTYGLGVGVVSDNGTLQRVGGLAFDSDFFGEIYGLSVTPAGDFFYAVSSSSALSGQLIKFRSPFSGLAFSDAEVPVSVDVIADSFNSPPTLEEIPATEITEDTLTQTISIKGVSAGTSDIQPLRVTATSSNPGLIPDPSVTYSSPDSTGSLALIPVADQYGTATITVIVEDGGLDGDLATLGDNATFSRTFDVTVTPAADIALGEFTVEAGDEFSVPISTDEIEGLQSVGFTLRFDASVLEPTTVAAGTLTDGWIASTNTDVPGVVAVSLANSSAVSGSGSLAVVTFRATGDGTTTSSLVLSRHELNDGAIQSEATDGLVEIIEPPSDILLTNNVIAENAAVGSVIGTLSSVDNDVEDTFTYSLVGGAGDTGNARFEIVGNELRSAEAFNHELTGALAIRVRSTDSSGLARDEAFLITVTDVNEAPTAVVLSPAVGSVSEAVAPATTSLTTVTVADDALGANQLWLSGPDADLFEIRDGQVFAKSTTTFDYEARADYALTVNVNDPAVGAAIDASADFTLTIDDAPAISLPDISAVAESVFDVPVSIAAVAGLQAARVVVAFDPAVLEPITVVAAGLAGEWLVAVDSETAGQLEFSLVGPAAVDGSGTIANLRFRAIGVDGSQSPLAITLHELNDGTIPSESADGSVTVGARSLSGTATYYGDGGPVPGAILTLVQAGSTTRNQQAGLDGGYRFDRVPGGTHELSAAVFGTESDAVSAYDAALILQHDVGLITLNSQQQIAADTDDNGRVTLMDAARILAKSVGLISGYFPNRTSDWVFQPASRTVSVDAGDLTAEDFVGILIGDVSGNWQATDGTADPDPLAAATFSPKAAGYPAYSGLSSLSSLTEPTEVLLGTRDVLPGTTLSLPLQITGPAQGLLSLDAVVTFDPTAVSITPDDIRSSLPGTVSLVANLIGPGQLKLALASGSALPTGVELANLPFTVSSLDSTTQISIQTAKLNEGQVDSQAVDGGFAALTPIETDGVVLSKNAGGALYADNTRLAYRGNDVAERLVDRWSVLAADESSHGKSILLQQDRSSRPTHRLRASDTWALYGLFDGLGNAASQPLTPTARASQAPEDVPSTPGPDLSRVVIESKGEVTLSRDEVGNLSANDTAIAFGGVASVMGWSDATGPQDIWPAIGAETIDSTNLLLLRQTEGQTYTTFEFDASWQQVTAINEYSVNEQAGKSQLWTDEADFDVDIDLDGEIGRPE